jgi:hypothetical protein
MRFFKPLLFAFLCFCTAQVSAQLSTVEVYGGVGALSLQDETFTDVFTGLQFVGGGQNFSLRQQGTRTSISRTEYEAGQSIQFGVEGHYSLGTHGSVYGGIRLQTAITRYREGNGSSEVVTSGPIDTIFFDPGNVGGGTIIDFCDNAFFGFGRNKPGRIFSADVGIPIGYRHRFLNDRIGLRVQGAVNVPFFSGSSHFTQEAVLLQQVNSGSQNCLSFNEVEIHTSDAYRTSTFVFRAGAGLDFALGHSFALGVLAEQQLNSTFESTQSFVSQGSSIMSVPEIRNYKPLTISLVGRYLIK